MENIFMYVVAFLIVGQGMYIVYQDKRNRELKDKLFATKQAFKVVCDKYKKETGKEPITKMF